MIHVACDLCGAEDSELVCEAVDTNYHFAGVFSIVRCKRCGLVYVNPRPEAEKIGEYYPEADYTCFQAPGAPSLRTGDDAFARVIDVYGVGPGRICDIGCGIGTFLCGLKSAGWQVSGIEPSAHARALCNQRLGEGSVFPNLEAAAFAAGSFDAVTLWHSLEHTSSPKSVLTEVGRILKSGGVLALAVPNFSSLEQRVWGREWIAIDAPRHLYHFTDATLRGMVTAGGLTVLDTYQFPATNSLAANVLRGLRRAVLDRSVRRGQAAQAVEQDAAAHGIERTRESYAALSEESKNRVRRIAEPVLAPAAWVISRMHMGPEIRLYARKAG